MDILNQGFLQQGVRLGILLLDQMFTYWIGPWFESQSFVQNQRFLLIKLGLIPGLGKNDDEPVL